MFWNYPKTKSGVGEKPAIRVDTPPYPEVLVESSGYTGFAALYGDKITLTEPGRSGGDKNPYKIHVRLTRFFSICRQTADPSNSPTVSRQGTLRTDCLPRQLSELSFHEVLPNSKKTKVSRIAFAMNFIRSSMESLPPGHPSPQ